MKKIFFIWSILFICIYAAGKFDNRSIKVNPGGTLSVQLISGEIKINVWDKNEILIAVDDENSLNIRQSSGGINIEASGRKAIDQIMVTIPSNFNAKIRVNAGDININGNIKGDLKIENSGGNISFNSVNGKVQVKSQGGDIKGIDVNGNTEIITNGGDITLGEIKGSLKLQTGGGDIRIISTQNINRISTSGGNIIIKIAAGNGDISTGAGNIDIKSSSGNLNISSKGGDIRVDKCSGNTSLKTGAGLLRIKEVKGNLKSETESGDINAGLTTGASKIDLFSRNGDIRIDVSSNLHSDILARAKDTNWWKDDAPSQENIKSDFKLYSLQRNKHNQEIECIYKINGGGSNIRIQTGNGKIFIKKI